MKYTIPSLDSSLFDWLSWRRRCVSEVFDQPFRCKFITSEYGRKRFKEVAVGWCLGEDLPCRPKIENVGLMCYLNNEHFWFHLRKEEFDKIFGEKNEI